MRSDTRVGSVAMTRTCEGGHNRGNRGNQNRGTARDLPLQQTTIRFAATLGAGPTKHYPDHGVPPPVFLRHRQNSQIPQGFKPNEQALFDKEIKVLSIVLRLPSLNRKAPRVVGGDPKSRTLVLEYPRLRWLPLHRRAQKCSLDINTLGRLKSMLCGSVNELYCHNVSYPVQEETIFLVKRSSGWDFFLGGWQNCTLRNQAGVTEWNKQKEAQLEEINRLFKQLEEQSHATGGSEHGGGDDVVEQVTAAGHSYAAEAGLS
ncbi:hypothetical protein TOPH_08992 [Tolypocladium ophioglossoides CBS 100239]|uniref:Uncharacterized protein n=1 Tax=Tolypocladium ophioglossoides (strain CBS 100239) TaxID=1163406 RepID=A0A0L0MX85_TOLOC|nr:hypothetical protein TOPH_08992 [Tolypocladium ophioglossoides CBS 100239]